MLEKIKKPIVIFDCETTGPDPNKDRIIQIYMQKHLQGEQIREPIATLQYLINPQQPIPPQATAVHGLTDSDVSFSPTFSEVAGEIAMFILNCDLGGHNIMGFDVPLLLSEFDRANKPSNVNENTSFYDTKAIFTHLVPRTLKSTLEYFTHHKFDESKGHDAGYDTWACGEAMFNMMEIELPDMSLDEVQALSMPHGILDFARKLKLDDEGWVVFNFGNKKGQRIVLHKDYIEWMRKNDFPSYTMQIADKALQNGGRWPE